MAHPQLAFDTSTESQQICFRCKYVGLSSELGAKGSHCPVCGFVLIVNSAPVALGRSELDELFENPPRAPTPSRGLPGLSPRSNRPRPRVSLPGSPAVVDAKVIPLIPTEPPVVPAPRKKPRKLTRLLQEIAAGGLLVAGVLLALGVVGVI